MNNVILQAENLCYQIDQGITLFDSIDLIIRKSELVGIAGKSGSGKTSLLHILSGLMPPTKGHRTLFQKDLSKLNNQQLSAMRKKHLGFVFQTPNLLPDFTPVENIALPLIISGFTYHDANKKAGAMMERLGIEHLASRRSLDLSGGEKQRVNIARAIVHKPSLVFADEPTGSLDQENADNIQTILLSLQKEHQCAVVIVSHDEQFIAKTERQLILKNGNLTERKN